MFSILQQTHLHQFTGIKKISITMNILLLCYSIGVTLLMQLQDVHSHGYMYEPISRNAVAKESLGYCAWSGTGIPCDGCPNCWNIEEPSTGCGIIQTGSTPYVFGDGALGYANTGG